MRTPAEPTAARAVRVLVVDDEPAVIEAYRQVLDPPKASSARAEITTCARACS